MQLESITHNITMTIIHFACAAACTTLLSLPLTLMAQDDRLTVHGSINMAYAKTDGLPYFGANKDGTTDYRVITLQFGYRISQQDRVVVQLLSRKLGTSPLNDVTPEVQAVWAFYEHKFNSGVSVKLGRAPLPRGLFNEIRYIGTLLPLFRVGGTGVYGETFENIDGVVVAKKFDVGGDWALETSAYGGGFNIKATLPTAAGLTVVNQRVEKTIGTQLWLVTPIRGVKAGANVSSAQPTPAATLPDSARPKRLFSTVYSVEADLDHAFARGEYTTYLSKGLLPADVTGWYLQAGVRPHEQVTVTAEYGALNSTLRFPAPVINEVVVPASREFIFGVAWKPSAQIAFKVEGHRYKGYAFDTPVATIIPPAGPPFRAGLAPASRTNMLIASVAVSF